MPEKPSDLYALIYLVVQQVPPGRVTTYGQISAIVGRKADARIIGYALAAVPGDYDVPWQRVINSEGRISLKGRTADAQRQLLMAEGVSFDAQGRVNFDSFGWDGPAADFCAAHGLNPAPSLKKDPGGQLSLF